ncbi:hypothetical protein O3M35_002793 [Rhynocoris fuscipes]|uniref:F-box domain-containing protein n=1 Tax=Rhynocoris fuscipes TaxID=488301 RepID=A0AAW1CN42_9HEMI
MDILKCLPPEISIKILAFLNLCDILKCSLVSRYWYDLTNTNSIWKQFWLADLPLKKSNSSKDFKWIFQPPCEWKLYYLNHQKVINNWIDDRYEKHEINGYVYREHSAAYDGRTLVINNYDSVVVYRVEKGLLLPCQNLSYKKCESYGCATNTTYIVVKYKPCIIIYDLMCDQYKVSHMLYLNVSDCKLMYKNEGKAIEEFNAEGSLGPFALNFMGIIGSTLYIYMETVRTMYAWSMKDMVCLTEIKFFVANFLYDNERVYVYCIDFDNHVHHISVYDENAQKCYTVWPDMNIGDMHINNHLLVAVGDGKNEVDVCAWDKRTGDLLHSKRMLVTLISRLHPKNDVLVDVDYAWPFQIKEVFAYNIEDNEIVWRKLAGGVGGYRDQSDIHSIVADRFLIFRTYSRRRFDIHDGKRGKYLYSLYGIDTNYAFISYDVLIYQNKKKCGKLVVHIYS